MKIGIDTRLWNESGVGRYTRNLIRNVLELDKKNEYVLFVRSREYDYILNNETQNSQNCRIVKADVRWHSLDEQFKFPAILKAENIDLMHFPYFSVPILYDRPFVVTIHDLILHHFPTGQASTLPIPLYRFKLSGYRYVVAQAAKKAIKIITVSNSVKKEIVDHLHVPSSKITVTYEGVDEQLVINKHQKSRVEGKYFLYVGNAYPHKNLDRLVDSFSQIVSNKPEIKLILIGREDFFYSRLKKGIANRGLTQSILFLRYVSDSELAGLYQNALALIVPSLMEGFSLPPLEAMSQKCLVLVSNIDVHKEICKDAAVYFDPLSIQDITAKMNYVLNNKSNTSSYIKKGTSLVKEFSWKKMAQQTMAVYNAHSTT